MQKRKYTIGGKIFIQKPLVLGQLTQILDLLTGLKLPGTSDVAALVAVLAGKDLLPRALAIVLSEPNKRLKDKDLEGLAEFMSENADYLTTLEVVEDFFDLTRPESVFAKGAGMMLILRRKLAEAGLTGSSAPSPPETSVKETKSSGGSPLGNANPS